MKSELFYNPITGISNPRRVVHVRDDNSYLSVDFLIFISYLLFIDESFKSIWIMKLDVHGDK